MNEIGHTLQALGKKSRLIQIVGHIVSIDPTGVVVDCGGGRIPARTLGAYLPEVNEQVWVFFFDDQPYVMGPSQMKPGQGTITAVNGNQMTLNTAYGPVTVEYNNLATPTVGELWKLVWQGGGFAVAPMSTSPHVPVPPPPPPVGNVTHVDTFTAIDAGSYSASYGGWNSAQVISSDSWQGCWFQGTKIADTIPSGASIQKVEVFISVASVTVNANMNLSLHNYTTKPGGAPTFGASVSVPPVSGWVTVANSFGDALKSGGTARGFGVNHGGFTSLSSIAQDGQTGCVRITSIY